MDERQRTVDCMQHLAAAEEVLGYTLVLLERAMQPVDGNMPLKAVALPAGTAQQCVAEVAGEVLVVLGGAAVIAQR